MHREIRDLTYQLPSLVESIRQGWWATCSSAAAVTSALAVVATGLLSAINDVVNNGDFKQKENPNVLNFLYIASFGAIIFNASATLTSLLLIDELGVLPTLASNLQDKPNAGGLDIDGDILVYYGLGKTWTRTRWHWTISLVLGTWCLFLQVILFIYITQTTSVKVMMTLAIIFAVLPMYRLVPKLEKDSSREDAALPMNYTPGDSQQGH